MGASEALSNEIPLHPHEHTIDAGTAKNRIRERSHLFGIPDREIIGGSMDDPQCALCQKAGFRGSTSSSDEYTVGVLISRLPYALVDLFL